MGLDARVYIDARRLVSAVDLARVEIDPDTGEVNPSVDGQFVAIQKRLGNASMIAWLSEQVASVLTDLPESALLTKVLYNATHSGDVIRAADFSDLQREIEIIRERYKELPATDLHRFLSDVEELIAAACEQGNPILFV